MLLSFVIPLYNCERYIRNCIDGLLSIDFDRVNFEVIIIDDGSTDNGATICQDYANKYGNIILINQKNKGASSARNNGMKYAKGDYIWFVDADDNIEPDIISRILSILKERKKELICFNHKRQYADHIDEYEEFKEIKNYTGVNYLKAHYCNYLWNKIYKRSAIGEKRFLDGTKNIEDMLFNMSVIVDIQHVICVDAFGYVYNCTNFSSTSRNSSLMNLVKLDQDSFAVLSRLKYLEQSSQDENKRSVLKDYLSFSIAGHLYSLFRFYSTNRLIKRIDDYRAIGEYPVTLKRRNRRASVFLLIANRKTLIVALHKLIVIFKGKRKRR